MFNNTALRNQIRQELAETVKRKTADIEKLEKSNDDNERLLALKEVVAWQKEMLQKYQ